ncbi:hypothetical protein [Streptomyces sp. NPDC058766]|uniref:hypothetical protein n=1 Tax=Streptomyces sp. NPDC058766 TaxID=3346630 RepID=UPI0036BF852C
MLDYLTWLYKLYEEAGKPGSVKLGRAIGCVHTTVLSLLKGPPPEDDTYAYRLIGYLAENPTQNSKEEWDGGCRHWPGSVTWRFGAEYRGRLACDACRRDDPPVTATPRGIEPRPQRIARPALPSTPRNWCATRNTGPNHRWILRSGDTVIGSMESTYSDGLPLRT